MQMLRSYGHCLYSLFAITLGIVKYKLIFPSRALFSMTPLLFSSYVLITKIYFLNMFMSTINEYITFVNGLQSLENFDEELNLHIHKKWSKWWNKSGDDDDDDQEKEDEEGDDSTFDDAEKGKIRLCNGESRKNNKPVRNLYGT